jgi:hypothetical protein
MLKNLRPIARHLTLLPSKKLDLASALHAIDSNPDTSGGFVHIHTPMPAFETTRIAALRNARQFLIAIALDHALGAPFPGEAVDIFFDPYHDRLGYTQFFTPIGHEPINVHHFPYPEARSTRFKYPAPIKTQWTSRASVDVVGAASPEHVLLAWFDIKDIFRNGNTIGFNVARSRDKTNELSSWSLATGNGFVDASSFGTLHLTPPDLTVDIQPAHSPDSLTLTTQSSSPNAPVTVRIVSPSGNTQNAYTTGSQTLEISGLSEHGKHLIYINSPDINSAPDLWVVDHIPNSLSKTFHMGMFLDSPDDLRTSPYSLKTLQAQLQTLKNWGVSRLNWIDYPAPTHAPAFWNAVCDLKNAKQSYKACGDLLLAASQICENLAIDCVATLKPFEQGFDVAHDHPPSKDTHLNSDQNPVSLYPRMVSAINGACRSNPAWHTPIAYPIKELTFISDTPLPKLTPKDFTLLTSADNRTYKRHPGPLKVSVEHKSVPHLRWTPAGPRPDKGTRKAWVLTLKNPNIKTPFACLQIRNKDLKISGRAFALAQSIDNKGLTRSVSLHRASTLQKGFVFQGVWKGWQNHSEAYLDVRTLTTGDNGLMFTAHDILPTILEPLTPEAQTLWLADVQDALARGAKAVDLRPLCHHTNCIDWSLLAFHPAVIQAFTTTYGRPPEPTEADLEKIRILRGQAFTDFLRKAHLLTRAAGARLVMHFESGIEVPVHLHTRMALHLDWQTWINQGLIDEIMLKFFSSQSRWVHESLMPLARKAGIKVHSCDLNNSLVSPQGVERAQRLIRESRQAGMDGLSFYEANSYVRLNPAGHPIPIGHADLALTRAGHEAK